MTPTRTTITLAIAALILSAAASLVRADELPPIPPPPVVIPTATPWPSPTLMPKGDPLFRRYLPIVQGGEL